MGRIVVSSLIALAQVGITVIPVRVIIPRIIKTPGVPAIVVIRILRTPVLAASAAGAAGVIDRAHLGRGQTIVDIGLSPGPDGELLGDVDFDAAEPLAAALTPKKGGVGAVTTAVLMAHTVEAAMRKCGLEE